ncbi:MAG: UDP-glucose/GDP-mannose dehydrogenase family protein [Chloroherpetonaceae bacterium]|nr:UDP-glucose/GDP-mannose dehydrogenase family protein [Chloroherpetonaceae bacterium]MCS7210987.1 UDP-glucose/GDP-mannose dehydrogenase family protein [Chloroherpetonaceae bacterium]MDW8020816.1 UDP-glucose/GDP-mannose dehydrogenase family protein [Chloroherpetonaceae bacterium]
MFRIAIVGTGYVGLVAGTCFAETGNDVICVDIVEEKVKRLSSGELTIFEPGLEVLFKRNLREGRLRFTTHLAEAVDHAELIFLALPTPQGEDGSADLRYVLQAAEEIGKLVKSYKIIVCKSTVPVGTAEKVRSIVAQYAKSEFDVVSNPEFLREGVAVEDFLKPERVVIGSSSERAIAIMKQLYEPFVRQGNPILVMDERSAELTKYAANAMLALRVSFMNEISNICDRVGANVDYVRRGIGTDSRIGKQFLYAGTGYGGSCFPKDVKAIIKTAEEHGYDFKILKSVEAVNEAQKRILVEKIDRRFGGAENVRGKKFALWGLSFKPNTDDIREAPSLVIIEELLKRGASIAAFDPEAMDNVRKLYEGKITFVAKCYDALVDADALVIVTEWNEFRNPDFAKMHAYLRSKLIFDGRNVYDPHKMKQMGFEYYSIGRPTVD